MFSRHFYETFEQLFVFLKSKSENRDLNVFPCVSRGISYDFITFIERLLSSLPHHEPFSCNTSVSPRYGGRSQECPDRSVIFDNISDVSCCQCFFLSFFRTNKKPKCCLFQCFLFSKNQNFEKVGKVFLRTWAGTGPSQHHVISRGRELFKHYIDSRGSVCCHISYRCYLLG